MIGTMSAMKMMTVTPMHILRNDNTVMEFLKSGTQNNGTPGK